MNNANGDELIERVTVRVAAPDEIERVRIVYLEWGYAGGALDTDIVYVAELDHELVGIVRRTIEYGLTMLRGMHVKPAYQRRGVGSHLLRAFVNDLHDVDCFGVPYAHLSAFYGAAGFQMIDERLASDFIQERMTQYRAEGRCVYFMRREAQPSLSMPDSNR